MRRHSTILLVDDQEVRRSLLYFLLWVHSERAGGCMKVIRTSSAIRAMDLLRQSPDTFDSVLSLLHPIGSDALGAWVKKRMPAVAFVTLEGYPRPDEIQHLMRLMRKRVLLKTGPKPVGWSKRVEERKAA